MQKEHTNMYFLQILMEIYIIYEPKVLNKLPAASSRKVL